MPGTALPSPAVLAMPWAEAEASLSAVVERGMRLERVIEEYGSSPKFVNGQDATAWVAQLKSDLRFNERARVRLVAFCQRERERRHAARKRSRKAAK